MKLGCCTGIENAGVVKAAGFDFIECTVVSLMPEEDAEYPGILEKIQNSPVPVEACNVFLPKPLKIVGESVDEEAVRKYVEKSLARVKEIGADTVVFGSGGARNIPDGFSRQKGEEQIVQFLQLTAVYAEPLELTIVIEPLNKKESNVINSVLEAVEFAEKVDRKPIKVLADFYHMEEEKEPLENIVKTENYLRHVHVADSDRFAPGTGSYPYPEFTEALKKAGYNNRISIECQWDDFEQELKQSRKFLDSFFADAKI